MCLCYSFFNCFIAPANCSRLTASPTKTQGSPTISLSYVRNKSINIQIQSEIVIGRTISEISLGSCSVTFQKLNDWINLDCKDTFLDCTLLSFFYSLPLSPPSLLPHSSINPSPSLSFSRQIHFLFSYLL